MGATATAVAPRAETLDADARVALAKRVHTRIKWAEVLAHGLGGLDLFLLLFLVLPAPHGVEPGEHVWPNLVGLVVYMPLTMVIGELLSRRWSAAYSAWIREGRDPDAQERRVVLQTPSHCLRINGAFWL